MVLALLHMLWLILLDVFCYWLYFSVHGLQVYRLDTVNNTELMEGICLLTYSLTVERTGKHLLYLPRFVQTPLKKCSQNMEHRFLFCASLILLLWLFIRSADSPVLCMEDIPMYLTMNSVSLCKW